MSGAEHPTELVDPDLAAEIELVGDLVVAASTHDRPMTRAEVDAVLGVTPEPGPEPGPDEEPDPAC